MRAGCERLRLMVSGSAALPAAMLDRFRAISGHTLLERYGMTEFGMGLGNPLHGERKAGRVGAPFPGVDVRLVSDTGTPVGDGEPGNLQIKSPGMFREYHGKPEATRASFTEDGWFITGDVATRRARRVSPPRPRVGRHPQDRRLQGLGARHRGDAARAPGDQGMRCGRRAR